jgi:hypothetical protein
VLPRLLLCVIIRTLLYRIAVIRGAVQALFEKRQMAYRLNKGGGSFTVNACSGITLSKEEQPTDSKVVVSDVDEWEATATTAKHKKKSKTGGWSVPNEKMGDDQIVLQKTFRKQQNEQKALKRAVSLSILDSEREQKHEEHQMQQALTQSLQDNHDIIEEEMRIQEALKDSARQLEQKQQEEESLRKLLDLSRQEYEKEEDELLKVLERSTLEF